MEVSQDLVFPENDPVEVFHRLIDGKRCFIGPKGLSTVYDGGGVCPPCLAFGWWICEIRSSDPRRCKQGRGAQSCPLSTVGRCGRPSAAVMPVLVRGSSTPVALFGMRRPRANALQFHVERLGGLKSSRRGGAWSRNHGPVPLLEQTVCLAASPHGALSRFASGLGLCPMFPKKDPRLLYTPFCFTFPCAPRSPDQVLELSRITSRDRAFGETPRNSEARPSPPAASPRPRSAPIAPRMRPLHTARL